MLFDVEVTQPRDDVAGQTDADHLHHGLEDEEDQVAKRRVGVVVVSHDAEGLLLLRCHCVGLLLRLGGSAIGEESHR